MVKPKGHIRTRHYTRKDGTTYTRYTAMVSVGYRPDGKRDRREGKSRKRAKDAQDDLQQMLAEAERGIAQSDMLLKDYCQWWLEHARPDIRDATRKSYTNDLNNLSEALGNVKLSKLTPVLLQGWVGEQYANGLKPSTITKRVRVVSQALGDAERQGLIAKNPTKAVKRPRQKAQHAPPLISESDVARLLEHCQHANHRLYAALYLLFALGLRSGELRGLTWHDYDATQGVLHIRRQAAQGKQGVILTDTKTPQSVRSLHLADETQRVLDDHQLKGLHPTIMFPSERGWHMHADVLRRGIKELQRELGLPHFRIHDARHFALTRLAQQGVDAATLARIAGHSSVLITYQRYIKVLEGQQVLKLGLKSL